MNKWFILIFVLMFRSNVINGWTKHDYPSPFNEKTVSNNCFNSSSLVFCDPDNITSPWTWQDFDRIARILSSRQTEQCSYAIGKYVLILLNSLFVEYWYSPEASVKYFALHIYRKWKPTLKDRTTDCSNEVIIVYVAELNILNIQTGINLNQHFPEQVILNITRSFNDTIQTGYTIIALENVMISLHSIVTNISEKNSLFKVMVQSDSSTDETWGEYVLFSLINELESIIELDIYSCFKAFLVCLVVFLITFTLLCKFRGILKIACEYQIISLGQDQIQ